MTEHYWQTHNSARKCYICKGPLHETRYNKVKYFDTSRKFIDASYYSCVKIKCEATEEKLAEAMYHTEGLSIEEKNIFKTASECCICKIKLQADINKNKVRDHDHFTGKYRGPAHRGCNLQLRIKPDKIKILLIYHGGKHYDFHHEIRELGLINKIYRLLPISICVIRKVASNLYGQEKTPEQLAKCFPIIAQSIPQHLLPLLIQK
ncbi:11744_t:CDS:2, partial [Racocetra persica]